ncbi:MAG: hypothetical protein LBV58_00360 [Acholeplasmatales bacterium]|jgi:hypothetical protein|nr:hypothetical protein [Acholeplasmatales bacterium]
MRFIFLIITLFATNNLNVTWENTVIDIMLGESPEPYFELPSAHLFMDDEEVFDPLMYYERGVEFTSLLDVNTNRIREYNIRYRVVYPSFDYLRNTITVKFRILDRTPPTFILVPSFTIPLDGKVTNYFAGVDVIDNYYKFEELTLHVDATRVNNKVVGTYKIIYVATDPSGNVSSCESFVNVIDDIPPSITLKKELIGEVNEIIDLRNYFTIKDNYNTVVTILILDDYIDYANIGIYPFTVIARDQSLNETILDDYFLLVDTTKPIIELKPNPKTIRVFTTIDSDFLLSYILYVSDNYNLLTINDCLTFHNIDSSYIGDYQVTFLLRDSSLNEAIKTLKVSVVDDIAPSISIKTDLIFDVFDVEPFLINYFEVVDNYYDPSDIAIKIDCKFNINVVGTYQLSFTATDKSKNTASLNTYLYVVDNISPIITQVHDIVISDFTRKNLSGYFTYSDNYTPVNNLIFTAYDMNIDYKEVGSYEIVVSVKDSSSNTTIILVEILIVDIIPPSLELSSESIVVMINSEEINYLSYIISVSDNVTYLTTENVLIKPEVNYFQIGKYQVLYEVYDEFMGYNSKILIVYVDDLFAPRVYAHDIIKKFNTEFDIFEGISYEDETSCNIDYFPKNINFLSPGTKKVFYAVTDLRGNTTIVSRNIEIEPFSKTPILSEYYFSIGSLILAAISSLYLYFKKEKYD